MRTPARVRLPLPLLLLSACGHEVPPSLAPPPVAVAPSPRDAAAPAAVAADVGPRTMAAVRVEPAAPPQLAPIDGPVYERAQSLVHAGRLRQAKRLLAKLLAGYPEDRTLLADFNDVQGQIDATEAGARRLLAERTLVILGAPPFDYTLLRPARGSGAAIPTLTLASKKKNAITDEQAWFSREGLHRPEYVVPPKNDYFFVGGPIAPGRASARLAGFELADAAPSPRDLPDELPLWVPTSYVALPLTDAILSAPMTIAVYGERVVAVFDAERRVRGLFDFEKYVHPPRNSAVEHELRWALATTSTLFVAHTNRLYAKDNKGQNAYLSALDLDTGELAWRSAPLTCNAESFALTDGGAAIVAGYGFTAEPDFVYVLDAATGLAKQKIPVPSGPEEIIAKEGRFYVRTYDHDLAFDTK